jgi:hypothetical protein
MNVIRKGIKYTIAWGKWVAAGKPFRSNKYIEQLYSICENCPTKKFIKIDDNSGQCAECECYLKRDSTTKNKLAWPTEACPDKHWKADVDNESSG